VRVKGPMSKQPDRLPSLGSDALGPQPVAPHATGDEFVRLFSRTQPRLQAYILTMVPNWADAADILQETSSVMWRKFEQFERGSNFFAWACQIARFEVTAYRKRTKREGLLFSDEFLAAIADTNDQLAATFEARQSFLVDCLQQLRPRDRELVEL